MCVHKNRIKVCFVLFFPTMQEYLIPMMSSVISTRIRRWSSWTNKRRLTTDDLYKLIFVSDPQISPDGKAIGICTDND